MADTIDLTGDGDEEAGPSRPPPRRARSPSLDLLVVEALPCAVCAQPAADGPALGGCKHSVCGACLRAACRRVSLSWPPPGGVGSSADAAFRAFVCPLGGCGQPLSDAALASALEPRRHAQALRFLAAAADSWLESEGARDCPHCGARSSVGREAPNPAPPPPPPPPAAAAAKGKGKAAPRAPPPGACRDCQRPVRSCGECGEGDTAASLAAGPRPPHACDPARLHALALLRALRELRAAHWAPGGGGGTAGGGKARKRPAAAAGAGTGYGGAAGAPSKAQRAAQAKAAAAEASADGAARAALTAACAALEACWGGRAGGQARAPPMPRAALCHAALAPCLAALLRSASLFDLNRSASLRAALRLVGLMGARPPLLPLLCLPSAAAAPVPPPGEPLWDGDEAEAAEEDEGASVSDLLRALAEQAGALLEAGGGGGGDELAALAREVRDADEALRARARAAGGGLLRRRRPPPPPARGAGAGAGAGAQAAAEAEYEAVMSKQTYDSSPLLATHYFRREAAAMGAGLGGEAGKQRMRRIAREAAAMRTGLPCHFGSCVAVRVDEERSDVLQVLIVPHRDTPYGNAVFVFDVLLPADYPSSPPRVQLLTTGGGKVRFNPNLYACGKVCLSLLGTWAGPGWQPGSSTLLQVLVSLQSLIFVEKPWFNEPGYEKTEGTPQGEAQSAAYCAQVAADSLAWALLPALRQPPPAFHAFLVQHFRRKHDDIAAMLRDWQAKARGRKGLCEAAILVHARSCEEALQRYAPRAQSGPVETVSLL